MNAIKEHFNTNWSAMTFNDWFGLGVTIVIFILMIALYVYVLHPSNREKLESRRYLPLEDEDEIFSHPHRSAPLTELSTSRKGGTTNE